VQGTVSGGVDRPEHQAGAAVLGPNYKRGKATQPFAALSLELDRDIDGGVEVEGNGARINRYPFVTHIADSAEHNPERWIAEDGFAYNPFACVQTVLYRHVLRLLASGVVASSSEQRGALANLAISLPRLCPGDKLYLPNVAADPIYGPHWLIALQQIPGSGFSPSADATVLPAAFADDLLS
jgi:hypothetical protein